MCTFGLELFNVVWLHVAYNLAIRVTSNSSSLSFQSVDPC
ncbi:23649_t:CDS:2 [Cetraspora pellucida]|uniref:23649_t:CDS:1 n=1 Tax=Cetraspora pellucida TaxID=1433469 RepID=A0A9N9BF53_9GLOM|nr:23649_t:CDS:2 [Cetraspora pellucida]